MNLGEIFAEVALLVNHDLTNSQLVGKLNQISRQLFREFPVPDKIYRFTTTPTPYYSLPADCPEDRIRSVVIDGTEYARIDPDVQSVDGPFCMVLAGSLYINPNTSGEDAYLYYAPRHVTLTADVLTATPSFPEDYHELLVYGLAKYAASMQRDIALVNNFQSEYDEIYKKALRGLKKMGLKRVRETTSW